MVENNESVTVRFKSSLESRIEFKVKAFRNLTAGQFIKKLESSLRINLKNAGLQFQYGYTFYDNKRLYEYSVEEKSGNYLTIDENKLKDNEIEIWKSQNGKTIDLTTNAVVYQENSDGLNDETGDSGDEEEKNESGDNREYQQNTFQLLPLLQSIKKKYPNVENNLKASLIQGGWGKDYLDSYFNGFLLMQGIGEPQSFELPLYIALFGPVLEVNETNQEQVIMFLSGLDNNSDRSSIFLKKIQENLENLELDVDEQNQPILQADQFNDEDEEDINVFDGVNNQRVDLADLLSKISKKYGNNQHRILNTILNNFGWGSTFIDDHVSTFLLLNQIDSPTNDDKERLMIALLGNANPDDEAINEELSTLYSACQETDANINSIFWDQIKKGIENLDLGDSVIDNSIQLGNNDESVSEDTIFEDEKEHENGKKNYDGTVNIVALLDALHQEYTSADAPNIWDEVNVDTVNQWISIFFQENKNLFKKQNLLMSTYPNLLLIALFGPKRLQSLKNLSDDCLNFYKSYKKRVLNDKENPNIVLSDQIKKNFDLLKKLKKPLKDFLLEKKLGLKDRKKLVKNKNNAKVIDDYDEKEDQENREKLISILETEKGKQSYLNVESEKLRANSYYKYCVAFLEEYGLANDEKYVKPLLDLLELSYNDNNNGLSHVLPVDIEQVKEIHDIFCQAINQKVNDSTLQLKLKGASSLRESKSKQSITHPPAPPRNNDSDSNDEDEKTENLIHYDQYNFQYNENSYLDQLLKKIQKERDKGKGNIVLFEDGYPEDWVDIAEYEPVLNAYKDKDADDPPNGEAPLVYYYKRHQDNKYAKVFFQSKINVPKNKKHNTNNADLIQPVNVDGFKEAEPISWYFHLREFMAMFLQFNGLRGSQDCDELDDEDDPYEDEIKANMTRLYIALFGLKKKPVLKDISEFTTQVSRWVKEEKEKKNDEVSKNEFLYEFWSRIVEQNPDIKIDSKRVPQLVRDNLLKNRQLKSIENDDKYEEVKEEDINAALAKLKQEEEEANRKAAEKIQEEWNQQEFNNQQQNQGGWENGDYQNENALLEIVDQEVQAAPAQPAIGFWGSIFGCFGWWGRANNDQVVQPNNAGLNLGEPKTQIFRQFLAAFRNKYLEKRSWGSWYNKWGDTLSDDNLNKKDMNALKDLMKEVFNYSTALPGCLSLRSRKGSKESLSELCQSGQYGQTIKAQELNGIDANQFVVYLDSEADRQIQAQQQINHDNP